MSRSVWYRLPRLAFLVIVSASAVLAAGAARPSRSTTVPSKQTVPPKPRKVSFVTEDNIVIHGSYTPPVRKPSGKAPIAILLHMYKHDRSTYESLVPHLHDAGFAVLAIDMRGHGKSVGEPAMKLTERVANRDTKLFRNMTRDVTAAYLWLAQQPDVDLARFVLVGASVGSSVALRCAVGDRSVDGVVCMTPGTRYLGMDSLADARKYGDRPLLLLASITERSAAEELAKSARQATVELVPGSEGDPMGLHGTRMFGRVQRIEQKITRFLATAAGPPPTQPVVASVRSDVYHQPDSGIAARISDKNRRWFSSPAEAAARGLRPPKSRSKKDTPGRDATERFPEPRMNPQPGK